MKKYDLYLFDFDGTLFDTIDALTHIFGKAYNHIGMEYDPALTVEFSRIPIDVGYRDLKADPNKFMDFVDVLHNAIDDPESINATKKYHDTDAFIKYLRDNKIKAGVVTSNKASHVIDIFNVNQIPIDTFSIYIGNQECHKFKPHPDPILIALDRIKYKGDLSKVAYIGDAMNDVRSANAAGVDAILIDRHNEYPSSGDYIRIESLLELFK